MTLLSALPSARPPFLTLAPMCVLLGTAIAIYQGAELDWFHFILASLGAVLAAVCVNTLNEYQDYHSGLDLITEQTPFSGGSGLLKNHQHLENQVLKLFQISLVSLFVIGIYFVWRFGLPMLVIGLLGLAVIITNTNTLNRHPWLCLVAPGLGFALLMVLGSVVVQGVALNGAAVAIALIPFFTINNLLLVNQLPDLKADKRAGRDHFAIHYSVTAMLWCFTISACLSLAVLCYAVLRDFLPIQAFWVVPLLLLNFVALPKLIQLRESIALHPTSMAVNVVAANLLPLCLAIVLFIS
ncbi:MAG: prenyltransferase [Pseudomonadota bacterium]